MAVHVAATITEPAGASIADINEQLLNNAYALEQDISAGVSAVSGINTVKTGTVGVSAITVNDVQATCAVHTCPGGHVARTDRSSSTTVSDANCCQAHYKVMAPTTNACTEST